MPTKTTQSEWTIEEVLKDARSKAGFIRQAQCGDTSTLPVVRQLLDQEEKHNQNLVTHIAETALDSVIKQMCGVDVLAQESYRREAASLRQKLTLTQSSPLEDLLIERIVLCWLDINYAQTVWSNIANPMWKQTTSHQDRIDRAHRRYLSAIKSLAQVRKMQIPLVMLNIADKQMNVVNVGHDTRSGVT